MPDDAAEQVVSGEIDDIVDPLMDELEDDIQSAAERLGLDKAEIADRVCNEIKARCS